MGVQEVTLAVIATVLIVMYITSIAWDQIADELEEK